MKRNGEANGILPTLCVISSPKRQKTLNRYFSSKDMFLGSIWVK
jgi:hypothetical protein